jgi:hypothetical protein
MALPAVVPVAGAIFAALGPWITRFFMAKGALMVAGLMGRLGLVLATNELVMEPLIDMVTTKWQLIPVEMRCWLGVFGIVKAASILISGMTLIAVKRVFLNKS